jgi:hypothetical protein
VSKVRATIGVGEMIGNHVRNKEQETDVGVNEPLALTHLIHGFRLLG